MSELEELRKEIDLIDREMASLFDKRMDLVSKIGVYKRNNNLKARDLDRENKIIDTNVMYVKDGYEKYYKNFIVNILKQSRNLQKKNNKKKLS